MIRFDEFIASIISIFDSSQSSILHLSSTSMIIAGCIAFCAEMAGINVCVHIVIFLMLTRYIRLPMVDTLNLQAAYGGLNFLHELLGLSWSHQP